MNNSPAARWSDNLGHRTVGAVGIQGRFHSAHWRAGWPWYPSAVVAATAAAAGVFVWLGWAGPLAAVTVVLVPSGAAWAAAWLHGYVRPFVLWRPYCRPEADGNVGFYILRIDDHAHGPAICQVTAPSGDKTEWSLYRYYRGIEERFWTSSTSTYPTHGLGWRYPDDFRSAPPLQDGAYRVRWRVDVTGEHSPILVAKRTFMVRSGVCVTDAQDGSHEGA